MMVPLWWALIAYFLGTAVGILVVLFGKAAARGNDFGVDRDRADS